MVDRLSSLFQKLDEIEQDLEEILIERRKAFKYHLVGKKAVFQPEAVSHFLSQRKSALESLAEAYIRNVIAAPFIYTLIIPLLLLDVAASLYQAICFRLWDLKKVARSDYVILDRHRLAYLNWIQKLNCFYCGYANGVLAYVSEIASRTEQFWCPIKHAIGIRSPHKRYLSFIDYGDPGQLQDRLADLREKLRLEN